jgi:acid phosphatase type 7
MTDSAKHLLLLLCICLAGFPVSLAILSCEPEQIHIALGSAYYTSMKGSQADSNNASIILGFVTTDYCPNATVSLREYPSGDLDSAVFERTGLEMKRYTKVSEHLNASDPTAIYTRFAYEFDFDGLNSGSIYAYAIRWEKKSETDLFYFRLPNVNPYESSRMLLIADYDHQSVSSSTDRYLDSLSNASNLGTYDFVIHAGDMAYDLQSQAGLNGDGFFQRVQTFAASVPFMVVGGNHEDGVNRDLLNFRNFMPLWEQANNDWYSFNVGLVHYIVFNMETVYHDYFDKMVQWMETDLEIARRPENMELRPWVVMITHRPLYCSHAEDQDCWVNFFLYQAVDDLAYKYDVDLYLCGHVHTYERNKASYRGELSNCSQADNDDDLIENYEECIVPPNVVSGTVGNDHSMEWLPYDLFETSYLQVVNISFGALEVINRTHLKFHQINSSTLFPVDEFYVIKSHEVSHAEFKVFLVAVIVMAVLSILFVLCLVCFQTGAVKKVYKLSLISPKENEEIQSETV